VPYRVFSYQLKYILSIIACIAPFQAFSTVNNIDLSGFARVVGGYLNETSAEYRGYDNSLSFKPNSLLGLKAEYRYNNQLSFVAQGVLSDSDTRKSKFDWLYVSYTPTENLQLDLGRFRTPLFEYSEVVDVGFAYPWVILPQTTYIDGMFASIDGLRTTYQFDLDRINISFNVFAGKLHSEVIDQESGTSAESDLLAGFKLRLHKNDFRFQLSYLSSDMDFKAEGLESLQDVLDDLNLNDINLLEQFNLDGRVNAYQFSAAYETVDYFALSETTLIEGEPDAMTRTKSFYLTLGLFHHNFTYYVSASKLKSITPVLKSTYSLEQYEQLKFLQAALEQMSNGGMNDSVNIMSVGVRWDLASNLALKAEVDFIDGKQGQRSTFSHINDKAFDRSAALYLFSLDWMF